MNIYMYIRMIWLIYIFIIIEIVIYILYVKDYFKDIKYL